MHVSLVFKNIMTNTGMIRSSINMGKPYPDEVKALHNDIYKIDKLRRLYVPRWVLNELKINNEIGEIPTEALGYVLFVKKDNDIVIKKLNIEV